MIQSHEDVYFLQFALGKLTQEEIHGGLEMLKVD